MQYKAQEEAFSAFSLVELMISLITVSLVSAAFAPVITKKLSRSMVTVKSAVAAIRSDCAKFDENGGKCNACIDESCLLCDIHCGEYQYKNIGKCLCENCSERSEGCLYCSSKGCDKCADGYYIDESLKCVKCPKGSKCPNGIKVELCPIGYYQDEEKKTTCKPCLTKNGNYTNKEGSIACLACVAGQYATDNDNNWSASENINGTQCLTCPLGWKCPDGKNPIACVSGAYQDKTGQTGCKTCPNGKFSPNSPSSSCSACNSKCAVCSLSATNCSSCANGNYLTGSSCTSCPANANCSGGTSGYSCNGGYTLQNGSCVIAHQQPVCEDSSLCTFTGSITGDWVLRIKGTTRVAFPSQEEVDLFAVGGGGGGGAGLAGGGCGGYTKTVKNQTVKGTYQATVGAGGAAVWDGDGASGGQSSFGTLIYANGGGGGNTHNYQGGNYCQGGSGGGAGWDGGGSGGSDGGNGGNGCMYNNNSGEWQCCSGGRGQGITTRAFGESTGELFAAGGGGSPGGSGGNPGGGGGWGGAATPNTGSGGGATQAFGGIGGNGGSGIILIRNARWKY